MADNSKYSDYNLWVWLNQAYDTFHKARIKELSKYDINKSQGAVLAIINSIDGDITLPLLSKRYVREINTLSDVMSRMEKNGMLRRAKDKGRKNGIRFILTEKGNQACQQSSKRESIKKIMSCLDKEDRRQFRYLCKKIRDKSLEELGAQADESWPV